MTTEFDHLWRDRANWKWGLVYHCKIDPRVIVPKRPKWSGRTLNFAHRKAYVVLLVTVLAIALPVTALAALGLLHTPIYWITLAVLVTATIVFYYRADLRA